MSGADLNVAPLIVWVAAFSTLISFATTIYHLMTSGARTNAKLIAEHAKRLELIERQIAGAPGRDDMHALHIGLTEMHGDLREMRATMKGNNDIMQRLENIVTRHEDHLLGKATR